jgi:hypothetical protein
MHQALGLQALNWLLKLEQRLQRDGSAAIKVESKIAAQVITWCIEQQLLPAHSARLPTVQFNRALLEQIAQAQQALGQACFRQPLSSQNRLQQGLHSQQELKSAGASPRQHRVLVRLNTPHYVQGLPALQFADLDWQQLPLSAYDALLVVENLDCFYQLERFTLALPYQQPLIIYRGDNQYGSGGKALSAVWQQTGKPCVYFGDADLAGLSIAISLGCSSILLPEFSQFQNAASPAMLDNKQLKFQPGLAAMAMHPAFTPYQQLICPQLKGLRQQQMQGVPLTPVPLLTLPNADTLAEQKS